MKRSAVLLLLFYSILFGQKILPDEWNTKFEKSNYLSTSNYDETVKYFQKIADDSEFADFETIGISPQGREMKCLVVSRDKIFIPAEAKISDKAIIMINNGIHSGEIEGKDACMLMLREMLITGNSKAILDNVILVIIPVFNLDGHERRSPYNRVNQNGPREMGWRTTAQNLNLNRDFTKADSPEMKTLLKLFREWLPDIFIDTHTTDGADYQYTITYGITKHQDVPPQTRDLVNNELIPYFENDVEKEGYLIAPYVGFIDGDYKNGIRDWVSGPRFSHGYAAAQNRIGLLIETHMLKPYKDRVFSTKMLLESVINFSNNYHKRLRTISKNADQFCIDNYIVNKNPYPIDYTISNDSVNFVFRGYKREMVNSKIAGKEIVRYTNKKMNLDIPYFNKAKISDSVYLPYAYIIPQEWSSLVDILKLHGIEVNKISESQKVIVEKYKFKNVEFAKWPYEGRISPKYDYDIINDTLLTTVGDYIIFTNQRSLGMITYLLEPKSNDSFVNWGFMNVIFERKEYFEEYSMEPIAQQLYNNSELLRKEFNSLVESDSTFADSSKARLNFFYEHSPYYDSKHNLYPIMRVTNLY